MKIYKYLAKIKLKGYIIMNKREIMKKVIQKVGYPSEKCLNILPNGDLFFDTIRSLELNRMPVEAYIFQHKFAKAFFQEDWKIRLQEMVLETNPLAYLEKYL